MREEGDLYTGVFVALASLERQTTPVWKSPTSHTCIETVYYTHWEEKT